MNPSVVFSIIFLILPASVLILEILRFMRSDKMLMKFLIAASGIYFSGGLLILILTILFDELPLSFVLISEIMMLFIFVFTIVTIRNVDQRSKEIADRVNYDPQKNN